MQLKHNIPKELLEFLAIPSISTQPEHKEDIYRAAHFLCNYMNQLNINNCQLLETKGYPIVYGEKLIDKNLPTVLIYGHYDVQPADPIEKWISPPFSPEIRATEIHPEGAVFARGACDDKGQLFIPLEAYHHLASRGEFPCNIKFIFEGEEEIGSISLPQFIDKNKELLTADFLMVCDTAMVSKTQPSLIYKLKGAGLIDIELTTHNQDLHSGIYGGIVANAITELCKLITKLEQYFHESIEVKKHVPTWEKSRSEIDFTVGIVRKSHLDHHPHIIAQHLPTLEINGIEGGYTANGHKTVTPNKASAKISVRSAVGENTQELLDRITTKVQQLVKSDFNLSIKTQNLCDPVQIDIDSIEFESAKNSLKHVFGNEPIIHGIGGSIPIVEMFNNQLNMNTVLMGFGLNSDDIHSPNEHFGLENFSNGVESYVTFLRSLPLKLVQKKHEQEKLILPTLH